jgi:hypothetical protein
MKVVLTLNVSQIALTSADWLLDVSVCEGASYTTPSVLLTAE